MYFNTFDNRQLIACFAFGLRTVSNPFNYSAGSCPCDREPHREIYKGEENYHGG